MRGLYEQKWQEAMAGVTIQPSEGLWDEIANKLDGERGRNNWLTILLIAATVTIAFSFPLTIGNSSLEVRESIERYIVQEEGTTSGNYNEVSDTNSNTIISQENGRSLVSTDTVDEKVAKITGKDTSGEQSSILLTNSNNSNIPPEVTGEIADKPAVSESAISITDSNTEKYGLEDFDLGNELMVADINDYYFIPYYAPLTKGTDRSLLAALNMGTGSLSASSGFGSFGGIGNLNADAAFFESPNSASIADERIENPGTTFYFGTGIELPIGRRWSLLAGVGYLAQKASGTSNIILDAGSGSQPLGAYDPIVPGTIFLSESYNYSVTNSYINIPITIKYPFVNRKIKFRGGIGFSTDFMIAHTLNSETYGKASYKPASLDYKTVVWAGVINLDISYSLNNQYSVALETGFRKGFTAIDNSNNYFPSSFTVGIVLFYKIK